MPGEGGAPAHTWIAVRLDVSVLCSPTDCTVAFSHNGAPFCSRGFVEVFML